MWKISNGNRIQKWKFDIIFRFVIFYRFYQNMSIYDVMDWFSISLNWTNEYKFGETVYRVDFWTVIRCVQISKSWSQHSKFISAKNIQRKKKIWKRGKQILIYALYVIFVCHKKNTKAYKENKKKTKSKA